MKDSHLLGSTSASPLSSTDLGLYVHIPYCLQKCHYCDFVKFEVKELPPIKDYFKLLLKELELQKRFKPKLLESLYFGGGTPSLAPTYLLEGFIEEVRKVFPLSANAEISLEINPGTLSKQDLKNLMKAGFNRFSLGVQTFKPELLKACDRKHSAEEALNDLYVMSDLDANYNLDLLFGLPKQSLKDLNEDLDCIENFNLKHVSPYNLSLPEKHFFNEARPSSNVQVSMMELIEKRLKHLGVFRYEVSNFAKPGFESQHNSRYWQDKDYIGLGLGAHSYLKELGPWGTRYWNTASYQAYESCLQSEKRVKQKQEILLINEALTDFCHTHLRQSKGLSKQQILNKFNGHKLPPSLWESLSNMVRAGLLIETKNDGWKLSQEGFKMPNEVFRSLCFLKKDFEHG